MDNESQIYIDKAREEILHPTFEVTKQYLAVHDVEMEDGLPKVERIDMNFEKNIVSVYFPITKEKFFLEVHLKKEPEVEVSFVWTENAHKSYLTATSENLSFEELSAFIKFRPLEGWSKGEPRKIGKGNYTFSRISYKPIKSRAYGLEKQLDLLLDELEKDPEGVRKLAEKSNAIISVCRHQYISANAGQHFSNELIQRLAKLNLGIDIDTYLVGNPLKGDSFV
jgi:hypothetical protein